MTNKPPDEHELEKWHERWEQSVADLENVWLARSPYLGGDHLTIADLLGKFFRLITDGIHRMILGICELMQPIASGYDLNTTKFPRVADWVTRVKKETQPHFDRAHRYPMLMREVFARKEKSKL